MTKAFVRKCNKCDKPFLKDGGCNRIKCDCGNLQCYVCEENVKDYTHFADPPNGCKCPLYGDMQEFLKKQVAVAQERTVRELLKVNGELEDKDVRVDTEAGTYVENTADLDMPIFQHLLDLPILNPEFPRPAPILRRVHIHWCYSCEKGFGSANALSQHQRDKHQYDCEICGECFRLPQSLDQHQRDKHQYDCEICGKCFRLPQSLDQHQRDKHGRRRRQ
jgi:Zinc finger, C2H2 type